MTSFADSEKRLIAAFGRIDRALESLAAPVPDVAPAEGNSAAQELAALQSEVTALRAENAGLRQRLAETGEEAVRLAAAAEALSAENARLVDGQGDAETALRAELEAIKAARAAEIAALDEIMATLEGFVQKAPRLSDAPYAEDVAPAPGDVVAFDQKES